MTTDEGKETGSQKGVAHFIGTPSPTRGTPFFLLALGGTDPQAPDDPTLPDRLWTTFSPPSGRPDSVPAMRLNTAAPLCGRPFVASEKTKQR